MEPTPPLLVVMLHGWNMRAADLQPFTLSLGVDALYRVPEAPHPVALAADAQLQAAGRAWWPVDAAARGRALAVGARDLHDQYPAGRETARRALAELLRADLAQHPGARLVLVGFSQGGMLACDTVLHEQLPVAGLALFSSSCIALSQWQAHLSRLRGLPVLVTHGRDDTDLAFSAGVRLRDTIAGAGADVQWLPFDGGHVIPLQSWRALRTLLRRIQASPS